MYRIDLADLKEMIPDLASQCHKPGLLNRIDSCLANVQKDIDSQSYPRSRG
jgi:hypothetical protein